VEGGYRVSARKPFGSGSPGGDLLVTSAPCRDEVLHFGIPFASEGVSLAGDWDTMGMRATGSQTIILDDVFVPEAAVVLKRPQGVYHPAWNVILTVALPLIMSVYAGIAEKATETAIGIAGKRHAEDTVYLLGELGNLLATTQVVHADMVRIANDLDFEVSTETANAVLARKTITANAALATVEKAMHVTGGPGFFRKFGLERLLRDVHAGQFHPLPEKRQQRFSGRLALGLDPISDIVRGGLAVAAE
jgi:acyl-CoA dehydrogenase